MKKIFAVLLTLIMMFALSVTAFGVVSPVGEKEYEVKTYVVDDVDGTTSFQWYKIIPEGDNIRLIVDDKYINSFIKWIIEGDYEIVSGTLTDTEILIHPKSDIDAYVHITYSAHDTDKPGKPDDSKKSPDTSAAPIASAVAVMALAGMTALIAKKKISK